MPSLKGGLLDKGAAKKAKGDAQKGDAQNDDDHKGWNFDPVTGKPLHRSGASKSRPRDDLSNM